MNRYRNHLLVMASISFGLLSAVPAHAASLQKVSNWGASGVPSYIEMYIYVPDKQATKPPIMVSSHSCGSTATGQMGNIPKIKAAADANGFILILPDNPGQNCWDVGTSKSLTHDGGGDTQAVAQMVKYALTKYNGDASRVYAMGGSSGAMMTQALMAVYPDIFVAGSARAGVPAGCWADGYDGGQQWSNNCAGGNTTKTAQLWGDQARAMDPGYTGHRPRLQIMQGDADQTISFKNSAESIKQWTNVLALSTTPTTTDMTTTSIATYTRQFWSNACGYTVFETWAGHGGGHSMGYEEDAILKFFGLDKAGGTDPEPACGGSSGAGGAGGMTSGGTGGASAGGAGGMLATGGTGPAAGSSGVAGSGFGVGGSVAVAGGPNAVGGGGSGGSGVSAGAGGQPANGGTGGSVLGGMRPGMGNSGAGTAESESSGCAFAIANAQSKSGYGAGIALGLALLAFRRRRRSA